MHVPHDLGLMPTVIIIGYTDSCLLNCIKVNAKREGISFGYPAGVVPNEAGQCANRR